MGAIKDKFDEVYRDFATKGVASSGLREPKKSEIRALAAVLETAFASIGLGALIDVAYGTEPELQGDLAHDADTVALVYADGTAANNDLWLKTGASGAGTWTNTGVFQAIVSGLQSGAISDLETAVASLQSSALTIEERTHGPNPADGSGTLYSNSVVYYWPSSEKAYDDFVDQVIVPVSATGHVRLVIASNNGNGTLTIVKKYALGALAVGVQTIPLDYIEQPAGSVVGLQFLSGGGFFIEGAVPAPDNEIWYTDNVPDVGTPILTSSANGVTFKVRCVGAVAAKAARADMEVQALRQLVGLSEETGWPDLVTTGSDTPSDYVSVDPNPAPADGYVRVTAAAAAPGAAKVVVLELERDEETPTEFNISAIVRETDFSLINGAAASPFIPVAAGQYTGIVGGDYKFQSGSNPLGIKALIKGGGVAINDTLQESQQHRFEVAYSFRSGLLYQAQQDKQDRYLPDDPRLRISDHAGIADGSPTARSLLLERPLVDGQGYEHCTPGGRQGLTTDAMSVTFDLLFDDLVERDDARNYVAALLVDGVVSQTVASTAGPNASQLLQATLEFGTSALRDIELVLPYGTGLQPQAIGISRGAAIGKSPARPGKKLVPSGDSITQGFAGTDITKTWAFLTAEQIDHEMFNMGYGGRTAIATDGTLVGQLAAQYGSDAIILYTIGVNNCIVQSSLAAFKAQVAGFVTNARAAAPDAAIVLQTPFYCASIEGSTIPLDDYRSQISDVVSESPDGNLYLVDGKAMMTNSTDRLDADLVHPNNLGHSEIPANLEARLVVLGII